MIRKFSVTAFLFFVPFCIVVCGSPTKPPVFTTVPVTPDAWKEKGSYFEHDRREIFYRDEGRGEVIVVLHGFPTSGYDWHQMWPALTSRHRVIAADFIGFGFSDKPSDYPYSIHDQADIVEELLRHLRVESVRIIAHDYGVSVGQELIARAEERAQYHSAGLKIESVVFLNGGLFAESHRPRFIQKLLASPIGFVVSSFLDEKSFRKNFSEVFGPDTKPGDEELSAFWSIIQFNNGNKIYHRLIHYIADRREHRDRWVGALQKTKIPLRLINGPEDPVSGRHMADRYKELIPNPDVVFLDGIGHYPLTEAPLEVLKALNGFRAGKYDLPVIVPEKVRAAGK